jgi:hypothetical protein
LDKDVPPLARHILTWLGLLLFGTVTRWINIRLLPWGLSLSLKYINYHNLILRVLYLNLNGTIHPVKPGRDRARNREFPPTPRGN